VKNDINQNIEVRHLHVLQTVYYVGCKLLNSSTRLLTGCFAVLCRG
jgi:hypothetical protein